MKHGKVYITGAGPGDPELLTIKALRVIREAEVILYDRLVHPSILKQSSESCELIYVGKQDKKHLIPQERINQMLLQFAKQKKIVVRLKGGDPLLFGRGGEEAIFLKKHNQTFEIIPGISSAMAVPAYAGIPLTHRGIASSCRIVTGHLSAQTNELPWTSFSNDETIVFLMSVSWRQEIARQLISAGRSPDEPLAFIEKGSTPEQRVTLSTLNQVASDPPSIHAPAIMIIGKVVLLNEQMQWFISQTKTLKNTQRHDHTPKESAFLPFPQESSPQQRDPLKHQ